MATAPLPSPSPPRSRRESRHPSRCRRRMSQRHCCSAPPPQDGPPAPPLQLPPTLTRRILGYGEVTREREHACGG